MRNTYTIDKDVNYVNELSHKNEPGDSLNITVDVRQYPSMFEVYDAFEHMMKTHYFILGNGFENVMKNVLLALKPKTMGWVKPTWGMLDVYCEALNIPPVNKSFEYNVTIAKVFGGDSKAEKYVGSYKLVKKDKKK